MIATHRHAISKRLYSYIGNNGFMDQYSDGKGAILCCPPNAGLMIPCGEQAEKAKPDMPRLCAIFSAKQPPKNSFHGRRFYQ